MNPSEWKIKLWEEVQQIPDAKLAQLYDLIHKFWLSAEPSSSDTTNIMQFAGCWSDMSDEAYSEFVDEIGIRRQQAFYEAYKINYSQL